MVVLRNRSSYSAFAWDLVASLMRVSRYGFRVGINYIFRLEGLSHLSFAFEYRAIRRIFHDGTMREITLSFLTTMFQFYMWNPEDG